MMAVGDHATGGRRGSADRPDRRRQPREPVLGARLVARGADRGALEHIAQERCEDVLTVS
jgi:hypothetical protein